MSVERTVESPQSRASATSRRMFRRVWFPDGCMAASAHPARSGQTASDGGGLRFGRLSQDMPDCMPQDCRRASSLGVVGESSIAEA